MSYDLGVWYASRPITLKKAEDFYDRILDDDLKELEPHSGIQAFLTELTSRYPQIQDWNDDDIDNCPWSIAFDQSDRPVILCMAYSRTKELVPFIENLASKHDLVCYNPQSSRVKYPPRVAKMPYSRLTLENDIIIDNPTSNQIAQAISSLNSTDNTFVILESGDMTYIQTAFQNEGEFVLEFQDGSLEKHYQTTVETSLEVMAAFQGFLEAREDWKRTIDWQKINL
jgi:hypothetical protein